MSLVQQQTYWGARFGCGVFSSLLCYTYYACSFVGASNVYFVITHTYTHRSEEMKAGAQSLVRRYVDSKGVTRFTGVKRKLKNSQLGPERLHVAHKFANAIIVS